MTIRHTTIVPIALTLALIACAGGLPILSPTETPTPTITPSPTATFTPTPTATPTPTPTPKVTDSSNVPVADVWVFPGTAHYAGDHLTIAIPVEDYSGWGESTALVTVNGETNEVYSFHMTDPLLRYGTIMIFDALDTTDMQGLIEVHVESSLHHDESGDRENDQVDLTVLIEVLPAEQRPEQEIGAEWQVVQLDCCILRYISGTAAHRDIETITEQVELNYTFIEEQIGNADPISLVFIDNVWGNGGYASGTDIVISYVDRDFTAGQGLGGLVTVIRHETTHALSNELGIIDLPSTFTEGIAVYLTGGHFKVEPIPERTAALYELGGYIPLETLFNDFWTLQHESRYLESAGMIAYMVETYGREEFLSFLKSATYDYDTSEDQWFDENLQEYFGVTFEEFESGYIAWLQSIEPGGQLADLEMTIRVQDIRRLYQSRYAPYLTWLSQPENLPLYTREGAEPKNVAIELMLKDTHEAITAEDYDLADSLLDEIETLVDTWDFSGGWAKTYLAISTRLLDAGYEPLSIDFVDGSVEATVTRSHPELETVQLLLRMGVWLLIVE